MRIEPVPYAGPEAQDLIARVQQEYVRRYGGPDATPVDPSEFIPPGGLFDFGKRLVAAAGVWTGLASWIMTRRIRPACGRGWAGAATGLVWTVTRWAS